MFNLTNFLKVSTQTLRYKSSQRVNTNRKLWRNPYKINLQVKFNYNEKHLSKKNENKTHKCIKKKYGNMWHKGCLIDLFTWIFFFVAVGPLEAGIYTLQVISNHCGCWENK